MHRSVVFPLTVVLVLAGASDFASPADESIDSPRFRSAVGEFDLSQGAGAIPEQLKTPRRLGQIDSQYFVVQLLPSRIREGALPELVSSIERNGGEVVHRVPEAALIARLTPAAIEPYHAAYKLHPAIGRTPLRDPIRAVSEVYELDIRLFPGEDAAVVAKRVEQLGGQVTAVHPDTLRVELHRNRLAALAQLQAVAMVFEHLPAYVQAEETTTTMQTGRYNQGATPVGAEASLDDLSENLRAQARPPVDYVASKFDEHQIVILGEAHWIRHDVELVSELVRQHGGIGFQVLASEFYPASLQQRVDSLVTADEWDRALGISILRLDGWPYEEYLAILQAAWEVNRTGRKLRVLALGPGSDWRETILSNGETYDTFMARRILEAAPDDSVNVLAHVGFNHAFTRYHQPDSWRGERVLRYIDRTGNVLWRARGQRVFMIALHPPFLCRDGERLALCTPVAGTIDCAASAVDRPVGFDLAGSPFAEIPVRSHYARGYRDLVLADLADGWIRQRSPDLYQAVRLIPLEDYAAGPAELSETLAHNPFEDEGEFDRAGLRVLWEKAERDMSDYTSWHGWSDAAAWREACPAGSQSR